MAQLQPNALTQHTKLQELSQLSIFEGLSNQDIEGLSKITTTSRARKGHIFFHQSEASQTVYLLRSGRVQLYRINPDGRKLIVSVLDAQMLFGEETLVGSQVHHTFAEAMEPCSVYLIPRLELCQLVQHRPQLALHILETTSKRLSSAEERLESLAFRDVSSRLSELLLTLATQQKGTRVTGFTHQDLAESIGTYRETATQALGELRSLNCIAIGRKQIDILDIGGLESIASL